MCPFFVLLVFEFFKQPTLKARCFMKKILVFTLIGTVAAVAAIFAITFKTQKTVNATCNDCYLRIHVRANSNDAKDQAVKIKVQEKIVEYLTPFVASCTTQKQSKFLVGNHLLQIEEVANEELKKNDFSYSCRASLRTEYFPTRSYGSLTLEKGNYDALILELGSGEGDNWWCVMFPPLCFVGNENNSAGSVVYKSKLWEIIKKYC